MRYWTLVFALLFSSLSLASDTLLEESFKSCAKKAIEGHCGKIPYWKYRGYELGLQKLESFKKEVHYATTAQTIYYPSEGFPRGQGCAYGIGVCERVVASNYLNSRTYVFYTYEYHNRIWGEIRQVYDTGAHSNDRRFHHQIEKSHEYRGVQTDFWIDVWVPYVGWRGFHNTARPLHIMYFDVEE